MKTEMNALPRGENDNIKNNQQLITGLSDEAFYLIALAKLLKKEFGMASLEQFLVPGGSITLKDKTAVRNFSESF